MVYEVFYEGFIHTYEVGLKRTRGGSFAIWGGRGGLWKSILFPGLFFGLLWVGLDCPMHRWLFLVLMRITNERPDILRPVVLSLGILEINW